MFVKIINIPKVQVDMDKEIFDLLLRLVGSSSPSQRMNLFDFTEEESNLLSTFYNESKYYRENHK